VGVGRNLRTLRFVGDDLLGTEIDAWYEIEEAGHDENAATCEGSR